MMFIETAVFFLKEFSCDISQPRTIKIPHDNLILTNIFSCSFEIIICKLSIIYNDNDSLYFNHYLFYQFTFCFLQVFISKSYDATSHFESTCDDILDLYEKIMGEKFDFDKVNFSQEEEQQESH
jgi:hypothetical protein